MAWLTNLFFGSFIFGLIFTVASFVLGGLGGHALGAHHIAGGDHNVGGDLPGDSSGFNFLSLFNFSALVVAITWFGGVGLVFQSLGAVWGLSVLLAVLAAAIGYGAIFFILVKVLYPMQTPALEAKDYDLYGTVGRISSTVHSNGVGELIYSKAGTRRAISVRSMDGSPIARSTKVVILKFDKGTAYVKPLDDVLNEHGVDFSSLDSPDDTPALPDAINKTERIP